MKKTLLIVLILGLVVLAGCSTEKATDSQTDTDTDAVQGSDSAVKTINIEAKRFEFSPNTIILKKGEAVKFVIDNTDTTHGISIPELGVSGIDSVEFTPPEAGTFEFRCQTMCGEGHKGMTGTIVVQE